MHVWLLVLQCTTLPLKGQTHVFLLHYTPAACGKTSNSTSARDRTCVIRIQCTRRGLVAQERQAFAARPAVFAHWPPTRAAWLVFVTFHAIEIQHCVFVVVLSGQVPVWRGGFACVKARVLQQCMPAGAHESRFAPGCFTRPAESSMAQQHWQLALRLHGHTHSSMSVPTFQSGLQTILHWRALMQAQQLRPLARGLPEK